MGRSKNARRVASIVGAGVALLFVVFGIFRRDLAVQYYVWNLHRNHQYVLELIREPESTLQGEAVRKFVGTDEGCLVLVQEYARKVIGAFPRDSFFPSRLESGETLIIGLHKEKARDDNVWRVWHRGARDGGDGIRRDPVLVAMYELLDRSAYRELGEFVISEHPNLRFRLLPGDEAFLASGITRGDGSVPSASEHLLLVRRVRAAGEYDWVSLCVLPLLFRALRAPEGDKRLLARETLEAAGYDLDNAVPQLIAMFRDPANRCSGGERFPWLCRRIDESTWFCWTPVARALIELGSEALPELAEVLGRKGWRRRHGFELARVLEAILRERHDRGELVGTPAERLTEIGRCVPMLLEMSRSDDMDAVGVARQSLYLMKQYYASGSSELITALEHKDQDVRLFAIELVAENESLAAKAFPQLVGLTAEENPKIRYWTAIGLAKAEREVGEVEPALIELLNDDDEQVRKAAKEALSHITGENLDDQDK